MTAQDDNFSLTTSTSYSDNRSTAPFSLLPRHFARLRNAHTQLAQQLPECWCARTSMLSDEEMQDELDRAVQTARSGGIDGDLRIRLNILPSGKPRAEAFPLTSMPSYPVRLVFDDRQTDYSDPFLRYKTTQRSKYDEARARNGATLHPSPDLSDPPFDVILFNAADEVTETSISNIAFRFSDDTDAPYITPRSSCGLLEGVQRAELLEKGEIVEGVVTVQQLKDAVRADSVEIICFNGVRGVFKAYIAKE
ncbi:hypothetical protein JCM10207_007639 [Rhodosporidiobolus poonsookiae]